MYVAMVARVPTPSLGPLLSSNPPTNQSNPTPINQKRSPPHPSQPTNPTPLPQGVRVIAWGLSLERPTMIKYRIANIRELFGHKSSLERTKAAPVCQF